MEPLIHLNYPLDRDRLLQDSIKAREHSLAHTDNRYPDVDFTYWQKSFYTSDYIEQIMRDLEVQGKPRFYYLEPNTVIPEHTDNGTTCSINIILNDSPAPITFGNTDYYYTMVLLNTSIPHSVKNNDTERILFKISIFDESYEDLANRIKYKL